MNVSDGLFKLAYENLKLIGGKSFTPREIDVVACVLSGKGEKAVASILSISPRGVESHTRNIRQKIGCIGRDGIIEFVEKHHRVDDFRRLYKALLEKSNFIKILKKIRNISSKKNTSCKLFYEKGNVGDAAFAKQIKEQLKVVGIEASLARGDYISETETAIFVGESEKFLQLQKKVKTQDRCISIYTQTSPKGVSSDRCIFFKNKGHDYLAFFSLLEKIMPDISLEEFTQEFNLFYKQDDEFIKKDGDDKRVELDTLRIGDKKKLFGRISAIVAIAVLLGAVFLFFDVGNKKITGLKNEVAKEKKALTWNSPFLPGHYIKREQQIKAIWEKFKNPLNKMVGIFGLGGVGKTFLAIDYFHDPKRPYDFKAWFHAESPSLIKASYIELGEKYNLFSPRMSDELKINEVKQWIENRGKVLLVYDNAPNMESIEKFIPQNVQVIITSRNYKVPNSVKIDVMSKEEALQLLIKNVPQYLKKEKNFKEDAEKLVEILNYIPLAISQAAGYITENIMPLSKYLRLYATERDNLLSSDIMPLGTKHEPIYVTWDLSLDAIKKEPEGKKITELLNFISFCYNKDIPKPLLIYLLFNKVDNKTEVKFNKLIGVLRQYSLVNIQGETLTIHQLVSHWIRDKVKKNSRSYYISKLKEAVENIYPKDLKRSYSSFNEMPKEKIHKLSSLVPHIEELLKKEYYLKSEKEKAELYILAAGAYYAASSLEKSKSILKKMLHLKAKKKEGSESIKEEKTLYNLAFIYQRQGNYLKAQNLLEKALMIYEKKYGDYSLESLQTLELLATGYHVLGQYKKRSNTLEKAILINEKFRGKDSPDTRRFQRLISMNFHLLGELKKARDFLQKSLGDPNEISEENKNQIAVRLSTLGWIDFFLGNRKSGKSTIDRGFSLFSKKKNQEDIRISINKIYSGLAYYEMGCLEKSIQELKRGLQIREKYHGGQHIWTAFAQANLAMAYAAAGEEKKAQALINKILGTFDKITKKMVLWSSFLLSRVGIVYHMLGDNEMAINLMKRALKHIEYQYGTSHLFFAIVSANLGSAYISAGEHEKGRNFLQNSVGIIKEELGPEHPFVGKVLLNMSLSYINDFKKKKKMKEKGLQILKRYYLPGCNGGLKNYNLILPL